MTAIVSQQTVQRWLWMNERGLVKVRSVVGKMATQWKDFKTAMKEERTGKRKAPSHDIV